MTKKDEITLGDLTGDSWFGSWCSPSFFGQLFGSGTTGRKASACHNQEAACDAFADYEIFLLRNLRASNDTGKTTSPN
jgi:hypothetical protein